MVMVLLAGTSAFAQAGGGTATLNGVVVDKDGGVIPGASVVIKNKATQAQITLVTNNAGEYAAPGISIGTYSVTVSLNGFKTHVTDDVRVLSGAVTSVPRVTLEVGAISDTVNVSANTELVHTQQTTVSNTVTAEAIKALPVVSRNALNFVTFLPNVQTPGTGRASTIAGLPQNAINISIDGVTTSNLLQSNDGFFSMVTPRLDAVEEVSVSVAGASADASAEGAVQIKFVTKSGTNTFRGTAYDYTRTPDFNTNYYFNKIQNLPKNIVKVYQYGATESGPIVIPGLVDGHGKAFFFFNIEEQDQPSSITRTRTVLTSAASNGNFTYPIAGGGTNTINLFQMVAANGNAAALAANNADPTIAGILSRMAAATQTQGSITTVAGQTATAFSTQNYNWQPTSSNTQLSPTTKIDVDLSKSERLSGSYWFQRFKSSPDLLNNQEVRFPGFVNFGTQNSWRTFGSVQLRSTLGRSMVNTVLGGWQTSPNQFSANINGDMFADETPAGAPSNIAITTPLVTSPFTNTNSQPRNTPNWNINDDFSWLKGKHSFGFGGNFTQTASVQNSSNAVPTVTLGFDTTNDPTAALFVPANFPGITSATDASFGTARSLYALLTGRVTRIDCSPRLNDAGTQYVYCGNLKQDWKQSEFGAYAQDSWRMTPTLTVNAGVRWDVNLPFTAVTSNFSNAQMSDICGVSGFSASSAFDGRQCSLFQPGVINAPGYVTQFTQYTAGTSGYNTDYSNFAPTLGAAWRPNAQHGLLRALLGDPDQALIRGTYSVSFNQPHLDQFFNQFADNPGGVAAGGARRGLGGSDFPLYTGGSTPLLLSQSSLLGPPAFLQSPTYPIIAQTADDVNVFDPNTKMPYVNTYSVGFQRSIGKDMAVEARYTGNHAYNTWTTENWDQANIYENSFLNEFKLAEANLAAAVASGCGTSANPCSFAYKGPGTGTSPLPIYLAYLTGNSAAASTDPTKYTGTNWTNSTFVNQLNQRASSSQVTGAANSLWTSTNGRTNGALAGMPANFFVSNPAVAGNFVTRSAAGTYYNSFTLDVRRRLSRGLQVDANYTYGVSFGTTLQDLHFDRLYFQQTGVPHALKMTWDYQIPVGRGKRFGSNMNSVMDAVVGGWEWNGTGRLQVNSFLYRGTLHNMTIDDVKKNFHIHTVTDSTGTVTVYDMPQDIVLNTQKAYASSATSATGYGTLGPPDPNAQFFAPAQAPGCVYLLIGDCGEQSYYINGPLFTRFDMSVKKKFRLGGARVFSIEYDMLNAFNNINFNHSLSTNAGSTTTLPFQVTSAYTDTNGTFDPGGRVGQLMFRIDW
jgi:hypothetical protein